MRIYPDTRRALIFHEAVQDNLDRIKSRLVALPENLRPLNVERTVANFGSVFAKIYDQALLPSFANEIRLSRSMATGETALEQYHSLFSGGEHSRRVQNKVALSTGVLRRRLDEHLQNSTEAIVESIDRFERDSEQVRVFLGGSPIRLKEIDSTGSDSHNRGRRVFKFVFESGKYLYYKPGPLELDGLACELMQELAGKSGDSPRFPIVVNKKQYGWSMPVRLEAMQSEEDGSSYWHEAGRILAYADVLNFSDGHFENLVATLDGPVLIDNETFFQNSRTDHGEGEEHSILFTALIQRRDDIDNERPLMAGYQIVGGTRFETVYPHAMNERTLDLSVKMSGRTTTAPVNIPIVNGDFAPLHEYVEPFIEGLRCGYNSAVQARENMLRSEPWRRASSTRARQIVRATMYYLLLIRMVEQPAYANDRSRARKFLEDKLRIETENASLEIDPNVIIDYEVRCLLRMDVPTFYCNPGSTDLISGDGDVYADFFARSAIDIMAERIRSLDKLYIDRQCEIAYAHANLGLPEVRLTEDEAATIKAIGGAI